MLKVGDTVRILPNKKIGKVTDISEGFIILDGNQARPYMPQQLELVLKRYVLLKRGTILTKGMFEEQKKVDDWFATRLFIKTSDNILDLVEPCKLWDLNGDLYEYAIDDFVFIEKVYDDTDFSTREVKAIYKRQTNGDYKRYEVEA